MDIGELIPRLIEAQQRLHQIEDGLDGLVAENSELVQHVSENWASVLTPGFWTRILKTRFKTVAGRKLTAKYVRAVLSIRSNFVMNVETVKIWRNNAQSFLVTFSDGDIRKFYDTMIALQHDPDFLEPLQAHDQFLYFYFLSKVPYILRHRDVFDGREIVGPLTFPRLDEVISQDQLQIGARLLAAASLGESTGTKQAE